MSRPRPRSFADPASRIPHPMTADIAAVLADIESVPIDSPEAAEAFRVRFLGRKAGAVTALFGRMGEAPPDQRRDLGQRLNALKAAAEARLDAADTTAARTAGATTLDLTLPGRVAAPVAPGTVHPLTQALADIEAAFARLGFAVQRGPEIEDDWHNFTALNFPPEHPARDMQDTFFLEPPPPDGKGVLLRTHTSPVQIRALEAAVAGAAVPGTLDAPLRVIAPGRVFRNEAISYKSFCLFHQVEGLVVDETATFADLKALLTAFAADFFGEARRMQFRPQLLPLHRALGRSGRLVGRHRRRALDGDPRLRHGGPQRPRGRRSGRGALHGLRLRHGRRAPRDAPPRHRRHPPALRERPPLPDAVLRNWGLATGDWQTAGSRVCQFPFLTSQFPMLVSLSWLSDYVDTGLSADETARLLTMSGLEVEGVERTGPAFDGVVVGHVLDVAPHPNADRLRVCQVDIGAEASVQIVCGAPNVAAGQTVPVATVGTVLDLPGRDDPSASEPVTIKKSKIRGEASMGMICAEDELGIGTNHDGILVLEAAEPGMPFADYLDARGQRGGDAVLDVNVTPNRPDATSHVGVARDLAALTGAPLRLPEVEMPAPGDIPVTITVEDADGCPRYVALVVEGVTVGPSPAWVVERLAAIGLRSINNVVDVTNLVLHESGQPLHAFDLDRLGDTVVVRRSRPGERLETLDHALREIPEGTLVIAGSEAPVAIAGVMGGLGTEVTEATTRVLIESAAFDPASVRRASKRLGLSTDASYRFERGVDETAQLRGAMRGRQDFSRRSPVARSRRGFADVISRPYAPRTTTLRMSRVARLLGICLGEVEDATPEEARDTLRDVHFMSETEALERLRAIGFSIEPKAPETYGDVEGDAFTLTIPPWRPDVSREVDVIEEVVRLIGLDRLPNVPAVRVPLAPVPQDRKAGSAGPNAAARIVVLGFHDLATNSLVSDGYGRGVRRPGVERPQPRGRRDAQPDLAGDGGAAPEPSAGPRPGGTAYNAARGADALRLVDVGHVYARAEAGENDRSWTATHEHASTSRSR